MDCCGKIGDILKSIMNAIRPLLAIALICVAAYFMWWAPTGAWAAFAANITWMPAFLVGASNTTLAIVAFGAALVVDSDTVVALAASGARAVGNVIGSVIGAVATGLTGGLFGKDGLAFLVGGLALYWFLTSDSEKKQASEAEEKKGKSAQDKNSPDSESPIPVALKTSAGSTMQ